MNHKINSIDALISISVSFSFIINANLIISGRLINAKNVGRFCGFIAKIITNHVIEPKANHRSDCFFVSFFSIVSTMPVNPIRNNKVLPTPIWVMTELREAGFCSATVVYTLGHIVVIATCLSLANANGPTKKASIKLEKSLIIVVNMAEDNINVTIDFNGFRKLGFFMNSEKIGWLKYSIVRLDNMGYQTISTMRYLPTLPMINLLIQSHFICKVS